MRKIHDRTSTNFNLSHSLARSFMVAAATATATSVCILSVSVALCMRMLFLSFSLSLPLPYIGLGRREEKIETWNETTQTHKISLYEDSNLIRALCGSIVTFKFAIVRTHEHHTHTHTHAANTRFATKLMYLLDLH